MKKTHAMVVGAAGFLLAANVLADGAVLFTSKMCMTCHGAGGKAPIMASYPKLAGQNATYCEAQIKDIRDGKRTNGMTMAMKAMVATVTDAEAAELCTYLASQ